ncbi:Acg family FMN-binding oxidoreductase [Streptomyces sp. NPDC002640]
MRLVPAPELDSAALDIMLTAAAAAPSVHNTQPWRFRLHPLTGLLEVRLDGHRALPHTDPDHRARQISVGAALENLLVAAAHLGLRPAVRLLPDPRDDTLLAVVDTAARGPHPAGPDPFADLGLYAAVARRRSSRLPYTGRPVPEPVVARMATAARLAGARLLVPPYAVTRRLLRLTAVAEARNRADPDRAAEARAWIRPPGGGPYGVPVTALGPADLTGRIPARDFTGPVTALRPPPARFERHVQLAVICTRRDEPRDRVVVGRALQRVLLVATALGVRTSLLHQGMEWPDLRGAAAALIGHGQRPQLLVRFGYGPEGPPTPRAPVTLDR